MKSLIYDKNNKVMGTEETKILVAIIGMLTLMIVGKILIHYLSKQKYPVAKAGGDSKGTVFRYKSIWDARLTYKGTDIKKDNYTAYIVDGNSMGKKNIINNDIILVRDKYEDEELPIGKVVLCKRNILKQYKEGMDYVGVIEYMYRF